MATNRNQWRIAAGLVALSAIPALGAAFRVGELAAGAQITPQNARFFAAPIPVVVHAVGASIFILLAAFQFVPQSRRPGGWHRTAGRILVPAGLAAALSGLWMTLFYPRPDDVGELLTAFRLVFGSLMAASLVLGFRAIRRRDIATHRAWMLRGYAIGVGVGTQAITLGLGTLALGALGQVEKALLMAAGWLINLAIAEWVIRRRSAPRSNQLAPTYSLERSLR
jgi:uncharacterized membrane protein